MQADKRVLCNMIVCQCLLVIQLTSSKDDNLMARQHSNESIYFRLELKDGLVSTCPNDYLFPIVEESNIELEFVGTYVTAVVNVNDGPLPHADIAKCLVQLYSSSSLEDELVLIGSLYLSFRYLFFQLCEGDKFGELHATAIAIMKPEEDADIGPIGLSLCSHFLFLRYQIFIIEILVSISVSSIQWSLVFNNYAYIRQSDLQNYYQIMKLGEDVLGKIEKLITQIDRPAKSRRTNRAIHQKENSDINPLYEKLYEEHRAKKVRHQVKRQQQLDDQKERCSPFKVTNKHSIFLNSQQQKRPLHERIQQIQNRKAEDMLLLRQKYKPKQPLEDEEEQEIIRQMEERKKSQRKFTPKEVEEKMEQLRKRQKTRMQKLNRLKIKIIEEHSKDFRCKPYVTRETQAHWTRYRMKKQLSTSVFERFQQYQIDRKTHLQNKQKEIRQQVTPFTPKISQNSRLIISRSTSRLDARSRTLKRSSSCQSCRCMKGAKKASQQTAVHTSRKY